MTLRGESAKEVSSANKVRMWLLSALLNRILGGSSDSMLTKLRDALQIHHKPNGDFPIAALDKAVKAAGRIAASSQDALENVMDTAYGDDTPRPRQPGTAGIREGDRDRPSEARERLACGIDDSDSHGSDRLARGRLIRLTGEHQPGPERAAGRRAPAAHRALE